MKNLLLLMLLLVVSTNSMYTQSDTLIQTPQPNRKLIVPSLTNDSSLPPLLSQFMNTARFYRVAVIPEVTNIKGVFYIQSDLAFLGAISRDGHYIHLNEELLEYPYLTKVILWRQYGKLYNLPVSKKGHDIMGSHWSIDYKHETYARYLLEKSYLRNDFFKKLSEKAPLRKRL